MKKKLGITLISAILCFCFLSTLGFYFTGREIRLKKAHYENIAENEAEHIITTVVSVMERINTLKALVKDNKGDTSFFDEAAADLYSEVREETGISLKNLAIAPDGVVSKVYPLEGNEALIGFDFLDTDRKGNPEAREAYEEGRTILTNPFELIQGGTGMAGRSPVLVRRGDEEYLWGLVTVTIDVDDMIEMLGIDSLREIGADFTLSFINDDGSTGVIYSGGNPGADAVRTRFNINNLTWELTLSPTSGWIPGWRRCVLIFVIFLVSVFVGIFTDMALRLLENRRTERELLISRSEQAMAANRAKTAFLSNMSHEIRTPINAMLGMNEMILRESNDDNILKYSENVKAAGGKLLSLVDDVLDFSKIESGKMELISVDYELSYLIGDPVNTIRHRITEKGLDLKLNIDGDIPSVLNGDEVRLKQIISNLLSNAVKYTKEGSIELDAGYDRMEDDPESIMLKVTVKDTGIGIKEEDIPKLFQKFERIEENRNRSIEGIGLGMNIALSLLRMMGSDLSVESVYGEGSVFGFAVKQKVVSWEAVGDQWEGIISHPVSGNRHCGRFTAPDARFLVVDDNPMNLMVFSNLIKQTKINIDTAQSGDEGIILSGKNKYDILFLDHMMPGKDGIEILNEIRGDKANPNSDTPAVCFTANAISGEKEKYISAGFDDYLSKPVDPEVLEELILRLLPEELIEKTGGEEEKTEKAEERSTSGFAALDDTSIDVMTGLKNSGTKESYLALLRIFRESIDEKTREMNDFYDENDLKNYTIKVHALKSSARIIGAIKLGEEAQKLENAGKAEDGAYIASHHEAFTEELNKLKDPLDSLLSESETEVKKPEAEADLMDAVFAEIGEAAADMDCERLDDIFSEMDGYSIPEESRELFGKLRDALNKYDYGAITELLSAGVEG